MDIFDRVREVITTTGTGSFTLSGVAATSHRAFTGLVTVGATVPYSVSNTDGSQWEVGVGTFTSSTVLARTTIYASSAGGGAVSFSSGNKELFITVTASMIKDFASITSGAYSTTVPFKFKGTLFMSPYTITGSTAFTVDSNPIQGATVWLRLTGNGTHTPTFTGFKEWGGNSGYDVRTGIVNVIQFFHDGVDAWYSISQEVGAVAAPTPASAVTMTGPTSGIVNTTSTVFTVNTNGTRASAVVVTPTPVADVVFNPTSVTLAIGTAAATFTATPSTVGAKTIAVTNSGTLTNPSAITYTATASATAPAQMAAPTATAGNGTVSVAYVAPSDGGSAITSYTATWSGGQTASGLTNPLVITGVTNGIAGTVTITATNAIDTSTASPASASVTPQAGMVYPQMNPGFTNLTETGSPGPYIYTALSSADFTGAKGGILNSTLQSGIDGSFAITRRASAGGISDSPLIGVQSSNTLVAFTAMPVCMLHSGGTGLYQVFELGAVKTAVNSVSWAAGDVMRLRRAGSTIVSEVSKNAGSTWTEIYTSTAQSTGVMYFQIILKGTGSVDTLTTVGTA